MAVPAQAKTQVIDQIAETIMLPTSLNDLIFIAGVLVTLSYFIFTFGVERKANTVLSRVGRGFMMLAFGAQFGSYVMTRASELIGRVHFLFGDWLGIIRMP